jgi:hypothetical protein
MVSVLGFRGGSVSMPANLGEEKKVGVGGIDLRWAAVCGRPARRRSAAGRDGGCRWSGQV